MCVRLAYLIQIDCNILPPNASKSMGSSFIVGLYCKRPRTVFRFNPLPQQRDANHKQPNNHPETSPHTDTECHLTPVLYVMLTPRAACPFTRKHRTRTHISHVARTTAAMATAYSHHSFCRPKAAAANAERDPNIKPSQIRPSVFCSSPLSPSTSSGKGCRQPSVRLTVQNIQNALL